MTIGFMLIAAIIMAIAVTAIAFLFDVSVQGQLTKVVDDITPAVRTALKSPDWKTQLENIARNPLLRERGISLAIIERRRTGTQPPMPVWQSRKDFPTRDNPNDQKAYRMYFRPSVEGPRSRDALGIVFAVPTKEIAEIQNLRQIEFIVISGLVVALVGLGAWMLVGKTLSPIGKLSKQAANASADDLGFALELPSYDAEMVELVDTVNGLLSRIAQTSAAKGRFYAAASHELRTPLQALSGHLELALTRSRTAEEYERVISEAHRQSERLTDLVQDLLLLHQLDTAPARAKESVQIASICRQTIDSLQPLLDLRKLTISLEDHDGIEIQSIHSHAEILVRNVLENAAKYADAGSSIQVSIEKVDKRIMLNVQNQCATAHELNTEKLFEPFYRPDASRNSRTGGNGLGLAISRAIAHANNWTIALVPKQDSVTVSVGFTISNGSPEVEGRAKPTKAKLARAPEPSKPVA